MALTLTSDTGQILQFEDGRTLVGRDKKCDRVVDDRTVSRRHAYIEKRADAWYVVDQGSANGTFLDGTQVTEARLEHGAELHLGHVPFRIESELSEPTIPVPVQAAQLEATLVLKPVTSSPLPPDAAPGGRARGWLGEALGVSGLPSARVRFGLLALVFLLAFAVRSLHATDLADAMYSARQPGTRMAWRYDETARAILHGEGILFPRAPDRARTGLLARPPGYGVFVASVYATLGRSFFAVQLVQNILTSLACVLLVLIGARLVSFRVGALGGLIAALSPHLAYSSNLILSDALSAVPLLAALLALSRALLGPGGGVLWSALAGVLVGMAAWLRPNVLLLPPCLAAMALVILLPDWRRGLRHALAVGLAGAAVIAPITVRNFVVFGEVVPISINGGLTLWQGVTDAGGYEAGARRRDKLVMDDEAARSGDPRYRDWWAEPDGIARDRDRYARARAVIRADPGRYARVMLRRMREMLQYTTVEGPALVASGGEVVLPLPRDEDGGVEPGLERSHDLGRMPSDERYLGTGRALSVLRPVVRVTQEIVCLALTPLVAVGVLVLLWWRWRSALVLLALPLYYLVTESFFIYEWRVAVPMHYALFTAAATALVLLFQAPRALRTRRDDTSSGTTPARDG